MPINALLRLSALELFAPIVCRLPRFDRFFYWNIGGQWTSPNQVWPYRRVRLRRCWRHGYTMAFDMTQELQRRSFYTGRYYERDVPSLVWELVRAGDCFVDIGANIGHITLLAARRVGMTGAVLAFEPNPSTRDFLTTNVMINGLTQIQVRQEALGDADGVADLHVNSNEPGQCTIRNVGSQSAVAVPVRNADFLRSIIPSKKPTVIKIDVEGYEMKVLEGLKRLLAVTSPAVIVEVTDEWLRQAGSSWAEMYQLMSGLGYSAYKIEEKRTLRKPSGIALTIIRSVGPDVDFQFNVVFARSETEMHSRLLSLLERP